MPDLAAAYVDHVNAAVKNCAELAGIKWKIWPSSIDYLSFLPGGKTYGRSLLPDAGEGKRASACCLPAFSQPLKAQASNS